MRYKRKMRVATLSGPVEIDRFTVAVRGMDAGVALCSDRDRFDRRVGRRLATQRTMLGGVLRAVADGYGLGGLLSGCRIVVEPIVRVNTEAALRRIIMGNLNHDLAEAMVGSVITLYSSWSRNGERDGENG